MDGSGTRFWLGVPEPVWLTRTAVPLFVSHRRLRRVRKLPRALGSWALDSGAFSELAMFGRFETSARDYVAAVRRYRDDVGQLAWCAIQDWMCEPFMLQKTGRNVVEHQELTISSFEELSALGPELPWLPVLQGYTRSEYLSHVDQYARRGIELRGRLVGLGSVCRRQRMGEGIAIAKTLTVECGLRLHGFGVKVIGLRQLGNVLASADSMAWSYRARRSAPLPGHAHRSCSNCLGFALAWRQEVVGSLPTQCNLFA